MCPANVGPTLSILTFCQLEWHCCVVFWFKRQHGVLGHKWPSSSLRRRARANDRTTLVLAGLGLLGQKSRSLAGADLGQWRAVEYKTASQYHALGADLSDKWKTDGVIEEWRPSKLSAGLDQTHGGGGFIPESQRLCIRAALVRAAPPPPHAPPGTTQPKRLKCKLLLEVRLIWAP